MRVHQLCEFLCAKRSHPIRSKRSGWQLVGFVERTYVSSLRCALPEGGIETICGGEQFDALHFTKLATQISIRRSNRAAETAAGACLRKQFHARLFELAKHAVVIRTVSAA